MENGTEAVLLRIFVGESDEFGGKPLYRHIVEELKKRDLSGVTVVRGIAGFGKTSKIHTASILRLSTDLPIVIEVADRKENIGKILPMLEKTVKEGLIIEEKVKILFYGGNKK